MSYLKLHSLEGTCPIFKTRQIGFSQIKDRNTWGNSEITKCGQTFNEVAHDFNFTLLLKHALCTYWNLKILKRFREIFKANNFKYEFKDVFDTLCPREVANKDIRPGLETFSHDDHQREIMIQSEILINESTLDKFQ